MFKLYLIIIYLKNNILKNIILISCFFSNVNEIMKIAKKKTRYNNLKKKYINKKQFFNVILKFSC